LCISSILFASGLDVQNIQGVAGQNEGQTSVEHYLLILEAQLDATGISRDLDRRGFSLGKRHQTIIEELKQIASLSQPAIIETLDQLKLKGSVLNYSPFFVSNIIAVECLPGTHEDLERISGVASVEKDEVLVLIQPVDAESTSQERENALDDIPTPRGLYDIRANLAWDLGFSGNGVLVANLDTGVDGSHPALIDHWRGRFGYPASECWLDLAGTIYSTPHGSQSHGSQTMGIICGMTPGDTIGVAWGAMFIGAEIDVGLHLTSNALQAFEWMLDPDGNPETFADVPRVISNSWGLPAGSNSCSDVFSSAIDNCEAAGTAVVGPQETPVLRKAPLLILPTSRILL
jgi:subtilisin family serine protease